MNACVKVDDLAGTECDQPESDAQALVDYVSCYYCSSLQVLVKVIVLVLWLLLVIMLRASTADNFFVTGDIFGAACFILSI